MTPFTAYAALAFIAVVRVGIPILFRHPRFLQAARHSRQLRCA
jgi:hypothetical protein